MIKAQRESAGESPVAILLPPLNGKTGTVIMNTTTTTIERTDADAAAVAAFSSAMLMPAATVAAQIDEDAVLDGWLASMDTSEFETILGRLADSQFEGRYLLETPA